MSITIPIRMKGTKDVIQTPLFTGMILFEQGLGDYVPVNEYEEEAWKVLMGIRMKNKIRVYEEPELPEDIEKKLEGWKDVNDPVKIELRSELKPILESIGWNPKKGYFTMSEIHEVCMKSSNAIIKKHYHSISSRIREFVRAGIMRRVLKDGVEMRGHYQIVRERWKDYPLKIDVKT